MTKEDIKEGDIVLLRDGRRCIIIPYINDPNNELALYGVLKTCNPFLPDFGDRFGVISSFDYYDDDLTPSDGDVGYTIMAVSHNPIASASCLFKMLTNNDIGKEGYYEVSWDWQREEVKEVTMDEVEKKFGCKVKIVKEE